MKKKIIIIIASLLLVISCAILLLVLVVLDSMPSGNLIIEDTDIVAEFIKTNESDLDVVFRIENKSVRGLDSLGPKGEHGESHAVFTIKNNFTIIFYERDKKDNTESEIFLSEMDISELSNLRDRKVRLSFKFIYLGEKVWHLEVYEVAADYSSRKLLKTIVSKEKKMKQDEFVVKTHIENNFRDKINVTIENPTSIIKEILKKRYSNNHSLVKAFLGYQVFSMKEDITLTWINLGDDTKHVAIFDKKDFADIPKNDKLLELYFDCENREIRILYPAAGDYIGTKFVVVSPEKIIKRIKAYSYKVFE